MYAVYKHSEHHACTIKIQQSLCISHKIMETYRNQHAPKFLTGKKGMMHQWQHCYLSVTPENRPEHWPRAMSFHRMDMCAI
jgi:hypothetical protein